MHDGPGCVSNCYIFTCILKLYTSTHPLLPPSSRTLCILPLSKSLVQKILQQDQSAEGVPAATITAKAEIVSQSRRLAKEAVASVIATSTSTTERTLNLAAEKGASPAG
eukprot:scpid49529/ scgid34599/ 